MSHRGRASRVICGECRRSVAIAFNPKTGDAHLREHKPKLYSQAAICPGAGAVIEKHLVLQRIKEVPQ